jgi:hypothetical protein
MAVAEGVPINNTLSLTSSICHITSSICTYTTERPWAALWPKPRLYCFGPSPGTGPHVPVTEGGWRWGLDLGLEFRVLVLESAC